MAAATNGASLRFLPRASRMPLRVLSAGPEDAHARGGHPERPDRIRAALDGVGIAPQAAPPIRESHALRVHSRAHVARVRDAVERGAPLDADTYTTRASWDAALRSAGSALAAVQSAREGTPAISLARPPGHHATRDAPMGFCLLNNVSIAAHAAREAGERVAIVDVDVHHGNGTQQILSGDPFASFVSLHGWPLYPGSGAVEEAWPHVLNLPLAAGTGHEGYLEAFDAAVIPFVRRADPTLILVSCGFDAHHRDPLGNLALTASTYHAAISRLRALQPRIAAILEGGYDLAAIRRCAAATAAALQGLPDPEPEAAIEGARPWARLRERVARAHPGLV